MNGKEVINLDEARRAKEFIETANDRILELEHALYSILDLDRIDVIKEIAADALGEDLESYMEEEVKELNFDDDIVNEDELPW